MGEFSIAEEDLERYLEKSGDSVLYDDTISVPGRGFASMVIEPNPTGGEQLVIRQCYGDGKWWAAFFRSYARQAGVTRIAFFTARNPKAFQRRFGAHLVGYVLELPMEGTQ